MSQVLNIEKANLDKFLNSFLSVDEAINDNLELLDIAVEESDENSINEINQETKVLINSVEDLKSLRSSGFKGVLIGETFMRENDIEKSFKKLFNLL